MPTQINKFAEIEKAIHEARLALDFVDPADCLDWLVTVQLRVAELSATLMPRIQTRT